MKQIFKLKTGGQHIFPNYVLHRNVLPKYVGAMFLHILETFLCGFIFLSFPCVENISAHIHMWKHLNTIIFYT